MFRLGLVLPLCFVFSCFSLIFDIIDKIRPVNVCAGAYIALEAVKDSDDGDRGESVLHLAGQDWTVT